MYFFFFFLSNQGNHHYHGEDDAETRELNQEPVQIDFVLNDLNLQAILKPLNLN